MLIFGLGLLRPAQVARLGLRLEAGDKLDARERQEVAQLGRVEEIQGEEGPLIAP